MLVYLKCISRVYFENVTNFLYNGETLVSHQELNAFLETVQELKVTGFQTVEDENKSNLDVSENDLYSRIDIPHEDTQVHRTIANDTFQQDLTTIPSFIVSVENHIVNEQCLDCSSQPAGLTQLGFFGKI